MEFAIVGIIGLLTGAALVELGHRFTGGLINSAMGKKRMDKCYSEGYDIGYENGHAAGKVGLRNPRGKTKK
jgi:xanthosine utilization system XapX-like protein